MRHFKTKKMNKDKRIHVLEEGLQKDRIYSDLYLRNITFYDPEQKVKKDFLR